MEEDFLRTDRMFRLFVYGTLKRGFSNHEGFCANALSVEEATTGGELYELPFGFPALVTDLDGIPMIGTRDYEFDAAKQRRLGAATRKAANRKTTPKKRSRVFGEVFTFDDPLDRLPKLDHLEGFDPKGSSLYKRILIPVETATGSVPAWAYAIDKPTGTHLPDGVWPS